MKKKYVKNPLLFVLACVIALAAYLYTNKLWIFEEKPVGSTDTYVDFIDCGQGDSTLLVSNGQAVLIDATTGENSNDVVRHLKERGIKRLDYFILSHPHEDHIGGATAVLNAVEVDTVCMKEPMEGTEPTTMVYLRLLEAIDDKKIRVSFAEIADRFECGEFQFEILGPVEDYEDLNEQSIVLSATCGDVSFLFTGDQEKAAESDLLKRVGNKLKATVLKVGHHGSSGSSCDDFLDKVSPRYGVISCGVDNLYGHPHSETLKRLKERDIKYYRTDIDGTVTAYTDGKTVSFETEEQR
ncbi:MAG: MBL fold metallo-hydrolase [Clostridia bacterium]|nr:MBL fold metallo-hydrolase [Clostridia bacterium]